MTYRALPDGLYISTSPVAGQGVFTSKSLPVGTELGMSHIIIADEIIRTPLGGFINLLRDVGGLPDRYRFPTNPLGVPEEVRDSPTEY